MTIQIPDNFMGKPIKGSIERVLASANPITAPATANPQNPNPTGITNMSDCWQISGVQYRNAVYNVDLAKALLDNGSSKTQDGWTAHYETAISQNGFHTPDYPLLYGLIKTLYTARSDSTKTQEVEEAKKFLKDTSRARWLITLTRIAYQPTGEDLVIHNFGTRDTYEQLVDFITPDEWIKNTAKPASYQALLGTRDNVQQINEVFRWLNDTDAYAWKVNSKPDNLVERVAWFYANSGRAYLYCSQYPTGTVASLGVRAVRAKNLRSK